MGVVEKERRQEEKERRKQIEVPWVQEVHKVGLARGYKALEQGYKRRDKLHLEHLEDSGCACISVIHVQHLIGALRHLQGIADPPVVG